MSEVIEQNKTPELMGVSVEGMNGKADYFQSILVSGFGQYHTDRTREIDGREYQGQPYETVSIADVFKMAENPPSVPKAQAQWVIPSSLKSRVHAEQREHGLFYLLWADFDQQQHTIVETHQNARDVTGADCLVYASPQISPTS